ncbi:hypothetical protein AMTRI_Chr04g180530 [Amborella trichopoda]
MDQLVIPQGWDGFWSEKDKSSTVYYAEYACWGPGANTTGRVPWSHKLTEAEAKKFREKDYINGSTWIIAEKQKKKISPDLKTWSIQHSKACCAKQKK